MLNTLPLMVLVVLAYVIVVMVVGLDLAMPLFELTMVSTAVWTITLADLLIVSGLGLLFLEMVGATRTDTSSIINHGLSMVVFIGCIIAFVVFPQFATSTFFIITLLALLDVVAGFTVTIVTARRDFAIGE